ncbi:hypothetical protein BCV69DRAFT_296654 [Microstroma glucosiphilum]|uniref:Anaphase-promoting complex subunit 5 n=1 Tax=Pseudomicrostroma glucosiphilum TaxID=1684307 RepID=A0A316UCV9_9BASI|nr:hypothetical protein BCV69DRAFT_296654 [Pseudomicrostroma glucosiphilum]PWN22674.1 hypothetical protein BCV69DRAFT_296654 [Pseudomicrostroma glucosiphilum]
MAGSADSPGSLTATHISWILLLIYYSRSRSTTPAQGREILGIVTQTGLEEEALVVRLLIYLVRCWDGVKPPPSSLDQLCHTLRACLLSAPDSDSTHHLAQVECLIGWLRAQWAQALETAGARSYPSFTPWLHGVFETSIQYLVAMEEEGIPDMTDRKIDKRSPLGIAVRRMALAYDDLDKISQIKVLERNARAWCRGDADAQFSKAEASGSGDISLPTRMQVFDEYQRARHRGDYSATKEQLHRFFDYAPPAGPRGAILAQRSKLHHHALLNLAGFQIEMEEWALAEMTLKEAITLARTEKDEQCLSMCNSLNRRLEAAANQLATEDGRRIPVAGPSTPWRPAERSMQRGRLYADDLWDASRAAREGSDVLQITTEVQRLVRLPLPASLTKPQGPSPVVKPGSAIPSGDPQRTMITQDAVRPWATAAYLSSRMGDVRSARRYRRLAREEPYRDRPALREADELVMRLQEAYALAEEGKYDDGLELMLDTNLLKRMSLADYRKWTKVIYQVLHLRARRAGALQAARRISVLACGKEEMPEGEEGIDQHLLSLYAVGRAFADANEGPRAMEPLLQLLQDARDCSHLVLYRRGTVLLARVLAVNMGLEKVGCEMMDDVMPELLADHNLERRAESSYAYARVLLAASPRKTAPEAHLAKRAISWLLSARSDLQKVAEAPPALLPVLNLLARLYHILDDITRRDEVSEEYLDVKSKIDVLQSGRGGDVRAVKEAAAKTDTTVLRSGESAGPLPEAEDLRDGDDNAICLPLWEELIATVGAKIAADA